MQLWRKATSAVWASNISWAQKLYLNMCVPPPAWLRCRSWRCGAASGAWAGHAV